MVGTDDGASDGWPDVLDRPLRSLVNAAEAAVPGGLEGGPEASGGTTSTSVVATPASFPPKGDPAPLSRVVESDPRGTSEDASDGSTASGLVVPGIGGGVARGVSTRGVSKRAAADGTVGVASSAALAAAFMAESVDSALSVMFGSGESRSDS